MNHHHYLVKHNDTKTVMRYDRGRENMELKAVNFLGHDVKQWQLPM